MDFTAIKLHTPQGEAYTIRNPTVADAAALAPFPEILATDGEGQILLPGELRITEEQERAWIAEMNASPDDLVLVAEMAGKVVGIIDFHPRSRRQRLQHVGFFGMGLLPGYRGRGIGGTLLKQMIERVKDNPRFEKITLNVLSNNPRAIHVYEAAGFRTEGVKVKEIKLADGSYLDELAMYLFVNQLR